MKTLTEKEALKIAFLLTFSFTIVEIIGGLLTNSLALFADGWHMARDSIALLIGMVAAVVALRPPTDEKTYGYHRAEVISAFVNGFVLILISGYILYSAIERFLYIKSILTVPMLIIATLGLLVNFVSLSILHSKKSNINVKGAYLHVLSDTWTSVGVIIGGITILLTRFYIVDVLIGFLIGIMVLLSSTKLVKETLHILLEGKPEHIDLKSIKEQILSVSNVKSVHDVHVWCLNPEICMLTAHIVIDNISQADSTRELIERKLKKVGISHITLQIEAVECDTNKCERIEKQSQVKAR